MLFKILEKFLVYLLTKYSLINSVHSSFRIGQLTLGVQKFSGQQNTHTSGHLCSFWIMSF